MSILEITISLAILSLLSLACFNTYKQYTEHKQLEVTAAIFISNLNYAKEMSIISNQTVYLCAVSDQETCDDTWQGNLVVFTSTAPPHIDNILKTTPGFPSGIDFETHMAGFTDNAYLYFMNNGELNNNGNFKFSNQANALCFTLSKTGIVSKVACKYTS